MNKGVHNIMFYVSPDPECSRTTQNFEISLAPSRGRILYAIYGNSTCVINHIVVTAIDKRYRNYYVSTGENHSQNLHRWILGFIQVGEVPLHCYGSSCWSVLEDEDVKAKIQLQLLEHTRGHHVTARDLVEVVSSPKLQQFFSQSAITKPAISEHTGHHWLSRLDWQYGHTKKGMYIDGHECEDVVEYRKAFINWCKEYQKCFHLYDNNGNPLPPPVAPKGYFPLGGRFQLILVTHDESTFYQNDLQKSQWAHKSDKPTPQPKGDGQSVMISDFLTADWGCLQDGNESVTFF